MELSEKLQRCIEQEARYQFPTFSRSDVWPLGQTLCAVCTGQSGPLAMEIELGGTVVFRYLPEGTTAYNILWMEKKRRTVRTMEKSSLRVWCELQAEGKTLRGDCLLDDLSYAACGGAFPIRLAGGTVIGAIAVSGLPHEEDHAALIEALRRWFDAKGW